MSKQNSVVVGIIGGTGIDQDDNLIQDKVMVDLKETPYGKSSDSQAIHGQIEGVPVYIISRHGKKHDINPSNVNYRANLWVLVKQLGCTHILTTSACGSLQMDVKPGNIGILETYFDRTTKREQTFYKVCHTEQKTPVDPTMRKMIEEACIEQNLQYNKNLISVCIEGPRFSTLPESKYYQSLGFHVINMTTVPEVPLTNELEVFYGCILLITDYDCWNDSDESVNATLVVERMKDLGAKARKVIPSVIKRIKTHDWSEAANAKANKIQLSIMAK